MTVLRKLVFNDFIFSYLPAASVATQLKPEVGCPNIDRKFTRRLPTHATTVRPGHTEAVMTSKSICANSIR